MASALEFLEDEVQDIDNAEDFSKIHGPELLVEMITTAIKPPRNMTAGTVTPGLRERNRALALAAADLRSLVAHVLGTAVKHMGKESAVRAGAIRAGAVDAYVSDALTSPFLLLASTM